MPHPHARYFVLMLTTAVLGACGDDTPLVEVDDTTTSAGTSTGPVQPTATGMQTTSTTGIVDEDGTSGTTAPSGQGCCEVHPQAGCDNADIAACVCDQEAFCCAFEWDQDCVDLAENQCGGCEAGSSDDTTTGGPMDHPCCDPSGAPGCPEDPALEMCVCDMDAFCCDMAWDAACTDAASRACGADCGSPVEGACCAPSGSPGCAEDPGIEMCVCGMDPFCCDEQWDGMCVGLAEDRCGAECMGPPPGGDCCSANGSPGCDDMDITDCVCAFDPFCCDNEWDGICVNGAHYACMAECGLPPANEGDCCSETPGPGCDDMMVTECVCMIDNGCCLFPWDVDCIQHAVNACGIMCAGFEPLPPCCQVQMGPGCGDPALEMCVCDFDPFCCDTEWDAMCVNGAQMGCMLDCTPGGGGSGSSGSGSGSGSSTT